MARTLPISRHPLRGLTLALLLVVLLGQPHSAAQAQTLYPLFVTPAAAAPGGQFRINGTGWPIVTSVSLVLRRGGVSTPVATLSTGDRGVLRDTLKVPAVAPGDYELLANGAVAALSPPIPFKVTAPPQITLSPASGPPGTEVSVGVSNLLAGTLVISYAGAAVIGPVAVRAGSYSGSFVVPADRPARLGSVASVVATNTFSGLTLATATTSFGSQSGAPRPRYSATGLSVPTGQAQPGGAITIQGVLSPPPVGPTDQIDIVPFWSDASGRRFPIGTGRAQINADGSFQVGARAPSRLQGDPASSHAQDLLGVEIHAPGGITEQSVPAGMMQPSQAFTVHVVKKKPGSADNGKPIPNKPAPALGEVPPLRVIIEPVDSFHITPDQLDTAISPGDGTPVLHADQLGISDSGQQALKNQAIRIANCYKEVSSIPEWEWRMSPDESVFASIGGTPGLKTDMQRQLAAGARQAARPGAEATILVQSLRVTIDASRVEDGGQKGYGEVDSNKTFFATVKYFLFIPSQHRAFLLDESTATADEVTLPAEVALAPLPQGWKSQLGIAFVDVVNDHEPPIVGAGSFGPYYSFSSEGKSNIAFEPVDPIRLRVSLNQAETGVPNVAMRLNNEPLTVQTVVETPPEGQSSPCAGTSQVTLPPSAYTYYEATIPNSHMREPGTYSLVITANDGANTTVSKQVPLRFVDYRPYTRWFDGPQPLESRSVAWYPGGAVLKGKPFNKSNTRLEISEDVEDLPGPQRSTSSLDNVIVTNLYPAYLYSPTGAIEPWHRYESTRSQTGSMDGESLDNATNPQSFGQGSSTALATLGLQGSSGDEETFSLLDTGHITLFKAGYGIPEIAFIGIAVDFRVRATLTLNYTLALDDIGLTARLTTSVQVRVKIDVDVLLGLADAEVGVSPDVGVQIPLELSASKGKADLGACFHYAMDLYYEISILWGIGSWDGTLNIFDGSEPNNCYQQVKALIGSGLWRPQSDPPVPEASPAVATDGLGNTMAVWRTSAGNIVASALAGGSWGPEQTVVANGKSGNPALAFFAPNQAVAVWSQSGLAAAPTAGTPLTTILSQQHLAYAIWNGSAWSAPQSLTLPNGGDGKVALAGCVSGETGCPTGGAVTAVWVHDAAGAYSQRQFRIYGATYQNGAWSTPQPVGGAAGTSETEPQVVYRYGQPLAFWVQDSDRSPQTLGDRRLATRALGAGAAQLVPNVPAGVLRPRVAIDKGGQLQLAFTTAEGGDGLVGNRHVLRRAVGASCDAQLSSCDWASEQLKDALGRAIYAESPVVAVDSANRVVLTYRAMGMSPFTVPSGPGADLPEPVGMQTLTGELAQLQLEPTIGGSVGLPSYLTNNGAVNWRPTAVYDPQLDSVVTLVVRGAAPAVAGLAALPVHPAQAAPMEGPAAALAFASTPRMPNFVAGTLTPGPSTGGLPTTVSVSLQNSGTAWQQESGGPALTIQATWDGAPGVGAPAGQATLDTLDAGAAATLDLSLQAPPASPAAPHTLVVTVNPGQAVAEASGDDNSLSLELGSLPAPKQLYAAVSPGSPDVQLTWPVPDDPRVTGYRIYQVDASGARTPVGSSFEPRWVDINAVFGQPYTYVVTSFDAGLAESEPSPAATATPAYAPGGSLYLPLIRR